MGPERNENIPIAYRHNGSKVRVRGLGTEIRLRIPFRFEPSVQLVVGLENINGAFIAKCTRLKDSTGRDVNEPRWIHCPLARRAGYVRVKYNTCRQIHTFVKHFHPFNLLFYQSCATTFVLRLLEVRRNFFWLALHTYSKKL